MSRSVLKRDAAGTWGGFLWWIAEPLFYCAIYYFLFAVVFQVKTENFVTFLLAGLVVWRWFATVLNQAAGSLLSNTGIIRQIDIPKLVFPTLHVIVGGYKFLIAYTILCGFLAVTGRLAYDALAFLPVMFLITSILFMGVALVVSAIVPIIPDLRNIIRVTFRGLFFLSGVFFEASRIPEHLRGYYYMNPLAHVIEGFRAIVLHGEVPTLYSLSYILAFGTVLCSIGFYVHVKYNRVFPRYLVM